MPVVRMTASVSATTADEMAMDNGQCSPVANALIRWCPCKLGCRGAVQNVVGGKPNRRNAVRTPAPDWGLILPAQQRRAESTMLPGMEWLAYLEHVILALVILWLYRVFLSDGAQGVASKVCEAGWGVTDAVRALTSTCVGPGCSWCRVCDWSLV